MKDEEKQMKLLGIEDILRDYETPEIESAEENVMKAVKAKRIRPKRVQILIAPIIAYLVSSVLFLLMYSKNAIFSFVWDFTGEKIVSFLRNLGQIIQIISKILPPFKGEYMYVPIAGMLIISVGALVMEKKNKKKGGNK
ncbi:MAG: hypothetical protein PHW02_09305 [bacterium]|nr:hypothetical protein [bacterium]